MGLKRAGMKEHKSVSQKAKTRLLAERHVQTELSPEILPKCVKKAMPTGPTQLAKSVHDTSDDIAWRHKPSSEAAFKWNKLLTEE